MKIIEPHGTSDADAALLLLLVLGVIVGTLGAGVLAIFAGQGNAFAPWVGATMAGVGGAMLQVAVIGYGVKLGVRAAR
ncbi:MAG TPA: hypothetical protein VJ872_07060 [Nocardioides sp.]|nr:hypothetical protein [Nocardioides sp.]